MSTLAPLSSSRQQGAELLAIYEISKILSSSLDLTRTLRGVLNLLASYMRMQRGTVSLLDAGDELRAVGAADLSEDALRRARYRIGEGITGRILQTGSPCVVPDVAHEPLFLNRTGARDLAAGQVIAFIGVPIKVGRDTVGVLTVDRDVTDQAANFETDVRFLSMVANLIGQTTRLHRSVAAERAELLHEKHRLQKELNGKYPLDNVIGASRSMQAVFAEVHQVASGRATVLLRGESGTGKEVIARAIHVLSPRSGGPFVRVNCAALSENLLESELFGHEKGAFTGATGERKGRFELADGGTLFLDEIGEVSPAFQTKLLRVLQEREFERVGGNRPIKTDVRLICATNRNLEEAVGNGSFREDLYFRINVVTLFLPPLRERREDIPPLVEHFLSRYNAESHRSITLSRQALEIMLACNWPGNVRELENCVERCATMTRGAVIEATDMPCQHGKCFSLVLQGYTGAQREPVPVLRVAHPSVPAASVPAAPGEEPAPDDERGRLVWAMQQCGWVQAKAARLLGITPRQIGYALRKYDVQVRRF